MSTPPTIQQGPRNPDPPATATSDVEVSLQDRMKGGFKENVWLHVRRVIRGDFLTEKATDEERRVLASGSRPITSSIAQDYAAWRKSVLWVAAAFMVVYAALEWTTYKPMDDTIQEETLVGMRAAARQQAEANGTEVPTISMDEVRAQLKAIKEQRGIEDPKMLMAQTVLVNSDLMDGIIVTPKLAVLAGAVIMVLAARAWADPKKSRRLSRLAWLIVFLTPFAITFIPITAMMDVEHIPEKFRPEVKKIIGPLFAMQVFIMIGPKAIALFPGVIRSSMSLKTLLPESATPGWVMSIMGPMYALFLVVIMSTVNQVYGDALLIGGILAFMAGSLIYALRAELMVRPHTPEETTSIVRGIRQKAAIANLIGVILLAIFIFRIPEFSFLTAVTFMAGVAATVLLLTIVATDFIVALMAKSFRQQQTFVGSDLEGQLDQRFDSLEGAGFTVLKVK